MLTLKNRRLQSVARSLETTFDKIHKRFNLSVDCFAILGKEHPKEAL